MDTLDNWQPGVSFLGIIHGATEHKGVKAITSRIRSHTKCCSSREDVTQVKPHPEHLFTAIRGLGVEAPTSLEVGDHPTDVMCGRAAGTLSVVFPRSANGLRNYPSGADFPDSGAVPELMTLLNGEKSRF